MSTDWIQVGAEVVYYLDTATNPEHNVRTTTITKVNARTFRVEGHDGLFPIESRPRISGNFSAQVIVPIDSAEGQAELRRARLRQAQGKVTLAHARWTKVPNPDYTAALIEAAETYQAILAALTQEVR